MLPHTEIQQIANLELFARQVVEGFITGLHKSPFHGFSVEFAEHRLYNQGENTRHIDWKLFGRSEKLFVKRYEEETNLRCQLILDISPSMYYPAGQLNKLKFSVYAAAALIELLQRQRDAFGLTCFDSAIRANYGPRASTVHKKLLYAELEKLLKHTPAQSQTHIHQTLHVLAEQLHQRSLVVIFSDALDIAADPAPLFSALQHLRFNKHEVIFFHVADKQKELDFDFDNRPYWFVDVETGEKVKLFPDEVRASYLERVKAYRDQLYKQCAAYRIDLVEADVNLDFTQILLPFLMKRQKLL